MVHLKWKTKKRRGEGRDLNRNDAKGTSRVRGYTIKMMRDGRSPEEIPGCSEGSHTISNIQ